MKAIQRIYILCKKQRRSEGSGTRYLSTETKLLSTMESLSGKTMYQEWRKSQTFSYEGKPRKNVISKNMMK